MILFLASTRVSGEIILSDVIDNDSWRLWEGGQKALMKDKQVYRNLTDFTEDELKKVKLNYDWVRDKLTTFKSGPPNTVSEEPFTMCAWTCIDMSSAMRD